MKVDPEDPKSADAVASDVPSPLPFDTKLTRQISVEDNVWFNPKAIEAANQGARKTIVKIVGICTIFIVLEAIGAYLSNSIAILTDVAHLVSDLIGFLFSLVAMNIATKKASLQYTFGYVRAEVLGALFSLALIWGLTVWIFYEAIKRLITKEYETVQPGMMLITAVGALFVNLVMAYFLHDSSAIHHNRNGHSHGGDSKEVAHNHSDHSDHSDQDHDHRPQSPEKLSPNKKPGVKGKIKQDEKVQEEQKQRKQYSEIEFSEERDEEAPLVPPPQPEEEQTDPNKSRRGSHAPMNPSNFRPKEEESSQIHAEIKGHHAENFNIKAAWIHIVGDLTQTIGVIIVALIIFLTNGYKWLDPVLSITFSIIAVSFSIPVLKDIIQLLMDSAPPNINMQNLADDFGKIQGVHQLEDLHVWLLAYGKPVLTAHITCNEKPEIVQRAAALLARRNGILHSTIQVDTVENRSKIGFQHYIHTDILRGN
jgi:zinc transporter 2